MKWILRIGLYGLLALMPIAGLGASLRIAIAIPDETPAYLELARAVRHNLQRLSRDLDVTIVTPEQIVGSGSRRQHGLVVTLGDALLDWGASTANPYRQTLAFYTTSTAWSAHAGAIRGSALFRDQPLRRQLALAQLLIPPLRSAVVLLADSEPPGLWRLATTSAVDISVLNINDEPQWPRALSQLMATHDVLLAHDDSTIYNRSTVRSLLLTTYRHGKVMIGPNRAFVEAGSLASAYTSTDQHLRALTSTVARWIATGKLDSPRFPTEYRVIVNRQVAASLGLRLPTDLELTALLRQSEGPQ